MVVVRWLTKVATLCAAVWVVGGVVGWLLGLLAVAGLVALF